MKRNVTQFFKMTKKAVSKHAPEILTGVGIAGMVITTISAVKATPKALQLIEEKKKEEGKEELKPMEVIKATWKCYVPAAITGVSSIGCLIGGSSMSSRRNAALLTALNLSQTAFTDYREKVVETIGDVKEKVIREEVAQKQVEKNPPKDSQVLITSRGKTLFYDYMSGRYFESDMDTIQRAANKINRDITIGDMYSSLNDFYRELELPHVGMGDYVGWNVDNLIELDLTSATVLEDNSGAAIVLGFLRPPVHDYDKLF